MIQEVWARVDGEVWARVDGEGWRVRGGGSGVKWTVVVSGEW